MEIRTDPNSKLADGQSSETKDQDEKSEVKFENSMPLEKAIATFEAILAGLRQGSFHVQHGDQDVTLKPASRVDVEVKAVHKRKKAGISLEIYWRVLETEKEFSISTR
jgi:amphi-Trp domain-containing protein